MIGSPPSSFSRPSPVVPGEILAEKYRVERTLGSGGMGVVVEAKHLKLGQRVALKFLHPDAAESEEAVGRFTREGQAAVQIQSEHVARVLDVGTLESGAPYIVMEFLEGDDLSALLKAKKGFEIAEAVDYVLQACEAVAEAHSLGIVHRDLKPANLFLTRRADGSELVKVLDFGISKMEDPQDLVSLTSTHEVMGSPQYMSPEQMRSAKHVDLRTDIWSVGAILHELITARPAFEADTFALLCADIVSEAPVLLDTHKRGMPADLKAIISRCLQKDLDKRYPTLAELAVDLLPFGSKRSRTSVERIVSVTRGAGLTHSEWQPSASSKPHERSVSLSPQVDASSRIRSDMPTWSGTEAERSRKRSRRIMLLGVASGVLASIAVMGAVMSRSGTRAEPPAVAEPALSSPAPASDSRAVDSAIVMVVEDVDACVDAGEETGAGPGSASPNASKSAKVPLKPPSATPTRTATPAPSPPAGTSPGGLPDLGGRKY